MALNRWRRNFSGNERVDLPDFTTMLNQAFADFDYLVKTYIDDTLAPHIIKRYQPGTHSANTFVLAKDQSRALMDENQKWLYVNPDVSGSTIPLTVPSNTTSYIEVQILTSNDDLQTRAFWNTDIGLTGQEFFDQINVRIRLDEKFQVSSGAFSGGVWIPLFTVVTNSGGTITSVTRADDLLWKPRSLSLPAANLRSNIYESSIKDLRTFIDFVGALTAETKGTGQTLESAPWTSIKLLREYQNIFYTSPGAFSWQIAAVDTLRISDALYINLAGRATTYQLGTASANNDFVIAEGSCLYVDIPEGATATLTPSITPISSVAIDPTVAGSNPTRLVLFYRSNNKIYGTMDIPEMSAGETVTIGNDLDAGIKTRLGILTDTTYGAYGSTANIGANDSYNTAIGKLDAALAVIQSGAPEEEHQIATAGQTVFNLSVVTMNASPATWDTTVFVNGVKVRMDQAGGTAYDWHKASSTQIIFSYGLKLGALVSVRQERTGGGGGSTDLTNITQDIQPDVAGNRQIGTLGKPWKNLFLKDTGSAQVYRIDIQSGLLTVTAVP